MKDLVKYVVLAALLSLSRAAAASPAPDGFATWFENQCPSEGALHLEQDGEGYDLTCPEVRQLMEEDEVLRENLIQRFMQQDATALQGDERIGEARQFMGLWFGICEVSNLIVLAVRRYYFCEKCSESGRDCALEKQRCRTHAAVDSGAIATICLFLLPIPP